MELWGRGRGLWEEAKGIWKSNDTSYLHSSSLLSRGPRSLIAFVTDPFCRGLTVTDSWDCKPRSRQLEVEPLRTAQSEDLGGS